jgi:hypothetical protein
MPLLSKSHHASQIRLCLALPNQRSWLVHRPARAALETVDRDRSHVNMFVMRTQKKFINRAIVARVTSPKDARDETPRGKLRDDHR